MNPPKDSIPAPATPASPAPGDGAPPQGYASSRKRHRTWLILLLSALTTGTGYWLLVRFVLFNFHEVVAGQVYRCSQPSPAFLEKTIQEKGIKSILKLNKNSEISWANQEAEVAKKHGVELIELPLPTRRLPSRQEILNLADRLEQAPRPLLIHCKAGADRTGVASTMIAMINGQSFDEAVDDQLRVAYLHTGYIGEDIADVLWQYKAERLAKGLTTGGWAEFSRWIREEYYPGFYHAELSGPQVIEMSIAAGRQIQLPITVRNASPATWPNDAAAPIQLGAYFQPEGGEIESRLLLGAIDLPASMQPGQSVRETLTITLPESWPAGNYAITVDVMKRNITWFGDRGSEPLGVKIGLLPSSPTP